MKLVLSTSKKMARKKNNDLIPCRSSQKRPNAFHQGYSFSTAARTISRSLRVQKRRIPAISYTVPLACALLLFSAVFARADVTAGESYGFGLQLQVNGATGAQLDLLGISSTGLVNATVQTGRLPSGAEGSAPAPYDTFQSTTQAYADGNLANVAGLALGDALASTSASVNLASVGGVFNGQASSNVNGLSGPRSALGFGSVTGLRLDLVDLSLTADTTLTSPITVNPPSLLSFTQLANTTLSSTSTIIGDASAFSIAGSSVIADLGLSINGATNVSLSTLLSAASIVYTTDANGNISVAPNTTLNLGVDAVGSLPGLGTGLLPGLSLDAGTQLQLTFNKQTLSGDPNLNPSITTTALDIQLIGLDADLGIDGIASLGVVSNFGIALGQSHAALIGEFSAIPEPSNVVYGLLLTAFVGMSRLRRFVPSRVTA